MFHCTKVKNKEEKIECRNYIGICLLIMVGKIYAMVMRMYDVDGTFLNLCMLIV